MTQATLTEDLKTRVEPAVKKAVEAIAKSRHMTSADIVREALREFLAKKKTA